MLTIPNRVPVVAGWRINAFYLTKGTKLSNFDSTMPLFLHPRFQGIKPSTGKFPYTEEQVYRLALDAVKWLLEDDANAKGYAGTGGGTLKRKPDDADRVLVEIVYVTEALTETVNWADVCEADDM